MSALPKYRNIVFISEKQGHKIKDNRSMTQSLPVKPVETSRDIKGISDKSFLILMMKDESEKEA